MLRCGEYYRGATTFRTGVVLDRLKILLTGKTVWIDQETKEETVIYEDWSTSWAIAGIHSYDWWWVRRYGKRECGCTINPITRRFVLYNMACSIHSVGWDFENDEFGEDD